MFQDRIDAAKRLLPRLKQFAGKKETLLLAIPRGALQIGAYLREALQLPLDIVITKKIGAERNEEYAIGAVDPDGRIYLNDERLTRSIEERAEELKELIAKRLHSYRGDKAPLNVRGKRVILVDDGVATGLTTLAAVRYLRRQGPRELILAIPVGSSEALEKLEKEVDELICLERPTDFYAVGAFYQDFEQVSDEEAIRLLS